MANNHSGDESSRSDRCEDRMFHRRTSKLTVSKCEGGARPLRAAAPAFLLRLSAATSCAAAGGKCHGVGCYHALRVHHTHPRGKPSFIGVVMGHSWIRVERCIEGAVISEIPAILRWLGWAHRSRQSHRNDVSVYASLFHHKGIDCKSLCGRHSQRT